MLSSLPFDMDAINNSKYCEHKMNDSKTHEDKDEKIVNPFSFLLLFGRISEEDIYFLTAARIGTDMKTPTNVKPNGDCCKKVTPQ